MKKITTLLLLTLYSSFYISGKDNYSTLLIKEELKENANAVVRYHEETFSIKSISSASLKIKTAITVLNKNGDDFSELILYYGKLNNISYLNANIYDANNNIIKKVKPSEIKDYSAVSGYSLYEDNRVKYYKPLINKYPYTVVYEYEFTYKGLLNYPTWKPQDEYDLSVEESKFSIIIPSNIPFRYKEMYIKTKVEIIEDESKIIYNWKISDLPALEEEPFDTPLIERTPIVYAAPNQFTMEDYSGNMETWNKFGYWRYKLLKDRDTLNIETKQIIKKLTASLNNKYEKVKKIYEYVQSKTRYVSIQEGIGGWQPFPASTVDKVGYGDCKALSNYTKALLKEIDIKSYYAVVRAGKYEPNLMIEFPINQTNHAFLCVPLEQDTIWLECTSQTNPFGYIGGFTDDRDVLVITEDGGKLVHTTVYDQKINTQHRSAEVIINPDGNGNAKVQTIYSALQYNNISNILYDSPEDQKKWLYEDIDIPSFEIKNFNIINNKNRIPSAELTLDLQLRNYASLSGTRMFIPVNLMNKRTYLPKKVIDRKTDVVYRNAFIDIDTIKYTIPEGYEIEYLPEPLTVNTEFGDYSITTRTDDRIITYVRNIKMNKATYPASAYEDFRGFLKKIVNGDKMKIVLVKKDA